MRKLCIPIEYRPEGGMYTFIGGFTDFLEQAGVPFTRRLGDDFDVLFVNSWAVPFDAVREVKRARPSVRVVQRVDGEAHAGAESGKRLTPLSAIGQILLLDLVFSIDSIVTAVGMTEHIPIMFVAVIAAVAVMLFAAGPLSRFIERNPTIVMLALGFLLVIGMTLIAEGFGSHVPKGYIYAAMAFSALVEGLNMLARRAKGRVRD